MVRNGNGNGSNGPNAADHAGVYGHPRAEPQDVEDQHRSASRGARNPVADLFGFRACMENRAFPSFDRLNVLLHRGRLRPAFLIVSFAELLDVVPLATHGFRLPAHVETRETVVHCSTVFAAWTYRDCKGLRPADGDALEEMQARSARNSSPTHCKQMRCRTAFGGTQNAVLNSAMNAEALYERSPSVSDAENWLALGTGALLLIVGASRRSAIGRVSRGIIGASAVSGHHRTLAERLERSSSNPTIRARRSAATAASTFANRFGSRGPSQTSIASGVASRTCRGS